MNNQSKNKLASIVVDDDELSRSMISHHIKRTEYLELVAVYENAIEAHKALSQNKDFDLLFLDIEMPEMSGIELLQNLNKTPDFQVIFTTSREEYAVKAFEHGVTDYLVKPIKYPRFLKACDKVLQRKKEQNEKEDRNEEQPEALFVRSNQKIIKILPDDILYIEALSDYIIIHTREEKKHVVHSTMKGVYQKLLVFGSFIRIHRSYIINLSHLKEVQEVEVSVGQNRINLPIGRSYRNEFMKRLDIL